MTLTRLKSLLAAATPGPWKIWPRDCKFYPDNAEWLPRLPEDFDLSLADSGDFLGAQVHGPAEPGRSAFTVPDAALIAALRNHADALIAVAEAAEELIYGDDNTTPAWARLRAALAALTPKGEEDGRD